MKTTKTHSHHGETIKVGNNCISALALFYQMFNGGCVVRIWFVLSLLLACNSAANGESVALQHEDGTLVVPVLINNRITLNFTIDSGAADVSVPADVFSTLIRAGTIAKSDLIDEQVYQLADGSEQRAQRFRVRSLRVGSLELQDVMASVAPPAGSLLLGQSFLSRFRNWSIDNQRQVLLINESPTSSPSETVASPSINVTSTPNWVLAGKRGGHGSFVDLSSIRVDGVIRLASTKLVYPLRTKRGMREDSDKWVNYIVNQVAVNCRDGRERDDFLSVYYDDGTVFQARISPPEWDSVTSGPDVTDALSSDAVQFICAWKPGQSGPSR